MKYNLGDLQVTLLGAGHFIAPSAAVIGDVVLHENATVWFGCVLRGDEDAIRIGSRSNLQDGTVVHVNSRLQGTIIGDDVSVGHMALLHACNIQDKAFVGMGSIVLDQCTIETHGMLAGGAMLTPGKTVKAGELWAGRPAKAMRVLSQEEIDNFDWSVEGYAERAQEYRTELAALANTRG